MVGVAKICQIHQEILKKVAFNNPVANHPRSTHTKEFENYFFILSERSFKLPRRVEFLELSTSAVEPDYSRLPGLPRWRPRRSRPCLPMTDPWQYAILMVCHLPSIYPSHVSIYTIHTDPMGYKRWHRRTTSARSCGQSGFCPKFALFGRLIHNHREFSYVKVG